MNQFYVTSHIGHHKGRCHQKRDVPFLVFSNVFHNVSILSLCDCKIFCIGKNAIPKWKEVPLHRKMWDLLLIILLIKDQYGCSLWNFSSDHAASSAPDLGQKRGEWERKVEAKTLDVVKNAIPNVQKQRVSMAENPWKEGFDLSWLMSKH